MILTCQTAGCSQEGIDVEAPQLPPDMHALCGKCGKPLAGRPPAPPTPPPSGEQDGPPGGSPPVVDNTLPEPEAKGAADA